MGERIEQMLAMEETTGLLKDYRDFQRRTDGIKYELTRFLLDAKRDGKSVAAPTVRPPRVIHYLTMPASALI